MAVTGVVQSVTPVTYGDALSADVEIGDTVLPLSSAIAFEEEFTEPRWLVIGDEPTPREYVSPTQNDPEAQQYVTLATPLATAFEAGLPVTLWDPASAAEDKRATDVKAWVRLDSSPEGNPIQVTVRHNAQPTAGDYALVGANVTLAEVSGEWYVEEVLGRTAVQANTEFISGTITGDTEITAPVIRTPSGNVQILEDSYRPIARHGANDLGSLVFGDEAVAESPLLVATAQFSGTGLTALKLLGLSMRGSETAGATTPEVKVTTTVPIGGGVTAVSQVYYTADEHYFTGVPDTASVANARVSPTTGQLLRSTSTRRNKANVRPIESDPAALLALEPKLYTSACPADDPGEVHAGFIAEEAHDLGLGEWVAYEADGVTPQGFHYERWVAALQAIARDQQAQIRELAERVAALEAAANQG